MKYYYVLPGSVVVVFNIKQESSTYQSQRLNEGMMFSPLEFVEYQYDNRVYVFQTMSHMYYVNEHDLDMVV